jgi:hypothetical protein
VLKPEGKRPLGDLSLNGKIILKWILKGTEYESVDWIRLAQDGNQ